MRTAFIILSVIVTAYAEAPYNLPRPPPHLPSFNYQPSSPPAAAPPPPPPPPVFAPAPPPPVFAPAPPPAPVFAPAGAGGGPPPPPVFAPAPPPPPPVFAPAPPPPMFAPAPPVFAPAPQSYPQIYAPAPQAVPRPMPQYITQQATSQYQGYSYPQPSNGPSFAQAPQQTYVAQPQVQSQQPIFAPAQPQPSYQPQQVYQNQQQTQQQYQYSTGSQTQAIPQPQPMPQQQQPAPQPSYSYGTPQTQYSPIRPLPAIMSPQPVQAPIQYYQQQQSQGATYQQPEQQQAQSTQLPAQNQNYNTDISSYQADSNQYNSAEQAQTHRDALDSVVVNRVQNIIKDNEHSTAKERGYLSLVSGVSLENAKPSLEILSFEHRSPLTGPSGGDSGSQATSSGSSSYSASSNSISSDADSGFGFLPQTKPATSYGVPN